MTTEYYAVCDANGPISVKLDGATEAQARASFLALDGRAAIDSARTDAEDALDIDGDGLGDSEFADALRATGASPVGPLGEVDQHGRAIAGDWYLWAVAEEGGIEVGDRVCGGEPGTEDYDEGRVLAVDGDQVTVAWDSGVRTTQPAELLRPCEEGGAL